VLAPRNLVTFACGALVATATLLLVPAVQAMATRVGRPPPLSRAFVELGWDPTWMVALGVSRRVLTNHAGTDVSVDLETRWPLLLLPNGELSAGATLYMPSGSALGVTLGVHPDLRLARDSTGTKVGLGTSFALRPGVYAKRFTLALDLAASVVFATYMHHSAAVRSLFDDRYPGEPARSSGPRDGLYALTSQRFRIGATGGVAVTRAVALQSSLGFSYTPQLPGILTNPPHAPLPFYVAAGGQYQW
jgi:hypothetical protein